MKPVFLAALLAVATPAIALAEAADTDGDGMVSAAEFAAAYPDAATDVFTEIDTNGDGAIDAAEMAAAVEAGTIPAME